LNRTAAPSATRGRHAAEHAGHRAAATVDTDAVRAGRRRLRAGGLPTSLTRRRQPSPTAVLLVAAFGASLAFLESTIVNIAFPAIQRYFHSSDISSLSWVLNGYNIAFAAFLVAGGRLADLLGRKRMFIYGVVCSPPRPACARPPTPTYYRASHQYSQRTLVRGRCRSEVFMRRRWASQASEGSGRLSM
jgi:Major Facilitator Superfamily